MTHTTDHNRTKLNAYVWPGGYPVMYLARDGWRNEDGMLEVNRHDGENSCCAACAADSARWPDLIVTASYIHYEGVPEYCEYCSGFTDSAYGDPDAQEAE